MYMFIHIIKAIVKHDLKDQSSTLQICTVRDKK